MYCTVVFWQRAFDSGSGYMYYKVWQSSCNLSTKLAKDLSQKMTTQYLNILNPYLDTIFLLPNLGTDKGIYTTSVD